MSYNKYERRKTITVRSSEHKEQLLHDIYSVTNKCTTEITRKDLPFKIPSCRAHVQVVLKTIKNTAPTPFL